MQSTFKRGELNSVSTKKTQEDIIVMRQEISTTEEPRKTLKKKKTHIEENAQTITETGNKYNNNLNAESKEKKIQNTIHSTRTNKNQILVGISAALKTHPQD